MKEDLEEEIDCNICCDIILTPARLPCGHLFCCYCIRSIMYKQKQNALCPLCRAKMSAPLIDKQREAAVIDHVLTHKPEIVVYSGHAQTINHYDHNETNSQLCYFLLRGNVLHGDVVWGGGTEHSSYEGEVGRGDGKVEVGTDGSLEFLDFKCYYSNSPVELWLGKLENDGGELVTVGSTYEWAGWGRKSSGILNIRLKQMPSKWSSKVAANPYLDL